MQASWNKHGEHSFVFELIEMVPISDLIDREQYWLDALVPKYNNVRKAGSSLGYKYTPEQRAKLVAAQKSYHATHTVSPEIGARISAALTGKRRSPEAILNYIKANAHRKGMARSDEDSEKIRQGILRYLEDPVRIAAIKKRDAEIIRLHLLGMTRAQICTTVGVGIRLVMMTIKSAHPGQTFKRTNYTNASGHRGINWSKSHSKWTSNAYDSLTVSCVYLGLFETIEEALVAQRHYKQTGERLVRKRRARRIQLDVQLSA